MLLIYHQLYVEINTTSEYSVVPILRCVWIKSKFFLVDYFDRRELVENNEWYIASGVLNITALFILFYFNFILIYSG